MRDQTSVTWRVGQGSGLFCQPCLTSFGHVPIAFLSIESHDVNRVVDQLFSNSLIPEFVHSLVCHDYLLGSSKSIGSLFPLFHFFPFMAKNRNIGLSIAMY